MEKVSLPQSVNDVVGMSALNARLLEHQCTLDWSAVSVVEPKALAALLAHLDISDDADVLGLETVPDVLAEQVGAVLEKTKKLRRRRESQSTTRGETRTRVRTFEAPPPEPPEPTPTSAAAPLAAPGPDSLRAMLEEKV